MKKGFLLAFLPIVLVLSSCSTASKTNDNYFIEDTDAHEEIFGALSSTQLQTIKLNPYKSLEEGVTLYQPKIGFQRKTNDNGTYSVRFVAAMQSATDSAYWTRSVHNLSGTLAKDKVTTEVTTVYSIVNGGDMPALATDVQAEDGTKPYDCYAVYCMLNIPNSYSDYYIDAFISVNNGSDSVNSKVGSINVADGNKHNTYSFGDNNRCLAFVNGSAVESGDLKGNKVALYSVKLNAGDRLQVNYVNQNDLTYSLCGNQSIGIASPDFSLLNTNDGFNVINSGVYNIYLNSSDEYYFEKMIYLQGRVGWGENDAMLELKEGSDFKRYDMNYLTTVDNVPQYGQIIDNTQYSEIQFYKNGGTDYTGFTSIPTDGKNYFDSYSKVWSVYGDVVSSNFSFDEAALNTAQRIHTNDQHNYLNFSGDYYNITSNDLNSFNATGTSNKSTPNKVTVSWNYNVPTGKTVSSYSLLYSQYENLSDYYVVEGTTAKSVSFYNPYLGDNYFKVIANFSDGSQEISPTKIFKVETQAPRNLYVGNMPNCRDMGGRTTYAGGKIKQGLIYRTAGNKFDNYTSVNDTCKDILANQLKVKTEINVGESNKYDVAISGNTVYPVYMDYGGVPYSNLSRNAEKIRNIMAILADENNYPVFYHCRIGTDRTGITGMMIGGLIGIPFNELFQDYCFSNFSSIGGQRYPHKPNDDNGDDPAKYIDEIKAMPGNTYQEQTYNALLTIGVPASTLNTIIDIMTEGAKAEMPTTGKIGIGGALTTTGTQNHGSNYNDPDIYYQITKNTQTSFATSLTPGQKDIVVYLGYTGTVTKDTTTLLTSCIELYIDGSKQTISNTKNLWTAGFGETQNNKRTGYMFNILGSYNLIAGNHTFTIKSINGTFNIGTICVFDHVRPSA